MKKIVISSYDSIKNPYYAGGGSYSVHRTAIELSKKFKVKIVSGKYKGARNGRIDKIPYEYIGFSYGGPKVGQIVYQLCLPFKIWTESFDIWIESFTPPFSTSFLPLFTKKTVIGLVHMLSSKDMQRKYKLPFGIIEKFGLTKYSRVITLQEATKKELTKKSKRMLVKVIGNGVDPIFLNNSEKEYVLFLGRVEVDQKGLDLLLEAVKLSSKKLKLVIAGSGEDKQKRLLDRLIKENGLQNQIELVGRVDQKLKVKLFEKAYCVVIPSRFETFSLVALEAISAGLPVVSFDITGLKWLPKEASVKVRPFSTKSLSKKVEDLVSNNKLRLKLGESGRDFSKQYSWEIIGKEYINALSNLKWTN